jgi:hypothetical protein
MCLEWSDMATCGHQRFLIFVMLIIRNVCDVILPC